MMSHPINDILGSPITFLDSIFQNLVRDEIDVSNLEMDHICFRTNSIDEYLSLKTQILQHAHLLSENSIGGRPILVVQLHQSLEYKNRTITVIEIPSPKPNRPYSTGFEHVEFVIQSTFESFMLKYPNVDWDIQNISKPINPDIRLHNQDQSVKFHRQSLQYVIEHLD